MHCRRGEFAYELFTNSSRDGQSDEDETVQIECVKCLRVLMNTDVGPFSADLCNRKLINRRLKAGFEQVLAHSHLITYIAYCLYTSSNKLRAQVADVLAVLSVLSLAAGHRVVLAALSDFRVAHDEKFRFEYLVNSIRLSGPEEEQPMEDSGIWEYRTTALSLVNAISNSPEDLEERIMLRAEFERRGLADVMSVRLLCSSVSPVMV